MSFDHSTCVVSRYSLQMGYHIPILLSSLRFHIPHNKAAVVSARRQQCSRYVKFTVTNVFYLANPQGQGRTGNSISLQIISVTFMYTSCCASQLHVQVSDFQSELQSHGALPTLTMTFKSARDHMYTTFPTQVAANPADKQTAKLPIPTSSARQCFKVVVMIRLLAMRTFCPPREASTAIGSMVVQ